MSAISDEMVTAYRDAWAALPVPSTPAERVRAGLAAVEPLLRDAGPTAGTATAMARAFYRSYVHNQRRAGQVLRFHIIREDGKYPGRQALCGTHAWAVTRSEPIIFDPMPDKPPAGLKWCPACVGHLSERMGAIDLFAAELAGVRP